MDRTRSRPTAEFEGEAEVKEVFGQVSDGASPIDRRQHAHRACAQEYGPAVGRTEGRRRCVAFRVPRRGPRAARPQRGRKDHHAQDAARAGAAERGDVRDARHGPAPRRALARARVPARAAVLPDAAHRPLEAMRLYGRLAGVARRGAPAPGAARARRARAPCADAAPRSRAACCSASGSRRRCWASPGSSSSTSRRPGSTRSASGTYATSCSSWRTRAYGPAVIHQLSEVEAVCDRVTILDRGRVAAGGHIDDLLNVGGQMSVRARGSGALPERWPGSSTDAVQTGGCGLLGRRRATSARRSSIDDAGWTLVSLAPKREVLEDYFARLARPPSEGVRRRDERCWAIARRSCRRRPAQDRLGRAHLRRACSRWRSRRCPATAWAWWARVFREVALALMFAPPRRCPGALGDAGPGEVERRTVFNVLARDVRRWQYLVGTWLGMFAVLGVRLRRSPWSTHRRRSVKYTRRCRAVAAALRDLARDGRAWRSQSRCRSVRRRHSVVGALAFSFVGHSVGSLSGPAARRRLVLPTLDMFNVINPVAHGHGYGVGYASVYGSSPSSAWVGVCCSSAALRVRADGTCEGLAPPVPWPSSIALAVVVAAGSAGVAAATAPPAGTHNGPGDRAAGSPTSAGCGRSRPLCCGTARTAVPRVLRRVHARPADLHDATMRSRHRARPAVRAGVLRRVVHAVRNGSSRGRRSSWPREGTADNPELRPAPHQPTRSCSTSRQSPTAPRPRQHAADWDLRARRWATPSSSTRGPANLRGVSTAPADGAGRHEPRRDERQGARSATVADHDHDGDGKQDH